LDIYPGNVKEISSSIELKGFMPKARKYFGQQPGRKQAKFEK